MHEERTTTERARRAGRREANLRVLNERIADASDRDDEPDKLTILCECAHTTCDDSIELDQATFDHVRQHDTRFVVREGHVLIEVEQVVDDGEAGWLVVEKRGEAARAAREELG